MVSEACEGSIVVPPGSILGYKQKVRRLIISYRHLMKDNKEFLFFSIFYFLWIILVT